MTALIRLMFDIDRLKVSLIFLKQKVF